MSEREYLISKATRLSDGSWLRLRTIKSKDRKTVEAMVRGKNVGYLKLRRGHSAHPAVKEFGSGHVEHVAVDPAHQRQGIGTKMWDRAEGAGFRPYHSDNLSTAGRAYRSSVGGRAMPIRTHEEREAAILHRVTDGSQGEALRPKPLEVLPRKKRAPVAKGLPSALRRGTPEQIERITGRSPSAGHRLKAWRAGQEASTGFGIRRANVKRVQALAGSSLHPGESASTRRLLIRHANERADEATDWALHALQSGKQSRQEYQAALSGRKR